MFGLFKRERFLTVTEKVSYLGFCEEHLVKNIGIQIPTNGQRIRIQLGMMSFLGATLGLSGRANEASLSALAELFLQSAEKIGLIRISEVFDFPDGYSEYLKSFESTYFLQKCPMFKNENTLVNGRGMMSSLLDIYGAQGIEFILTRKDMQIQAASFLLVGLAVGKPENSPDPSAVFTVPVSLVDLVDPIFGKIKV